MAALAFLNYAYHLSVTACLAAPESSSQLSLAGSIGASSEPAGSLLWLALGGLEVRASRLAACAGLPAPFALLGTLRGPGRGGPGRARDEHASHGSYLFLKIHIRLEILL